MNIEYIGEHALVSSNQTAFTYEVSDTPRDFFSLRLDNETLSWKDKDYHIGAWRIHPYGDNNNLPKDIQRIIHANSDAPGNLNKKIQLLWGKGPQLYTEEIQDLGNGQTELIRKWVKDTEVQKWLESWDYEEYLMRCNVDFNHIEGTFTKFFRNRAGRLGKVNKIAKLEHVSVNNSRLASVFTRRLKNPTHAVVTDFEFDTISDLIDLDVYPLFDYKDPFNHRVSMFYSNKYSFCMDYYTVPDIYGALEWIRRSNAIPVILKALSKNSINLKYHIISPNEFWEQEREKIETRCQKKGIPYKDSMLADYERDLLKQIAKVLSGEDNTGKFWHSKKILEVQGMNILEHGWEIKVIDQKMKDFVKSQIEISNHASQKVNTSVGVHSSLSNTGQSSKVDSGGEQYYALQNYLSTGVDIAEMIVMKPINYALMTNFPNKGLKLGFYHVGTKRLEQVTPSQRP